MTDDQIIELLKSGDFTLAYHDNLQCTLYRGKHEYEDLPENGVKDFENDFWVGYAPKITCLLVSALQGKIESI